MVPEQLVTCMQKKKTLKLNFTPHTNSNSKVYHRSKCKM